MTNQKRAICDGCGEDTFLLPHRNRWRCPDCGHLWPPRRVKQARRVWTRERIIHAIVGWVEVHGDAPTKNAWVAAGVAHPAECSVREVFGTWNAAIVAAGAEPRRPRRTRSTCIACGVGVDDRGDGCGMCAERHRRRAERAEKALA